MSFIYSFRQRYGSSVDLVSNKNKHQVCFLRDKGSRCVGLTSQPICGASLEILGTSNSWSPKGLSRNAMG